MFRKANPRLTGKSGPTGRAGLGSKTALRARLTHPHPGRRAARIILPALVLVAIACGGAYVLVVEAGGPPSSSTKDSPWQCAGPGNPEPGSPRAWEVGIPVSTYSVANSRDGNLITTLPIISWSGVGPDIDFTLYHNSAAVDEPSMTEGSLGFDLGPGWTTSYSSSVETVSATELRIRADDAALDVYTRQGNDWIPPPGVQDVLYGGASAWNLTHKDQSRLDYQADRLIRVVDATGHEITITKGDGSSTTVITDAAQRTLILEKGLVQGRYVLTKISNIIEKPGNPPSFEQRDWVLAYDTQGRLSGITDPVSGYTAITYDDDGRIRTITDRKLPGEASHAYTYAYDSSAQDRIATVTDPDGDGGAQGLVQRFSVDCETSPAVPRTGYTDRRGNDWIYAYGRTERTLQSYLNPLGDEWAFEYDGDRNMTLLRDPLGNEWTYDYDARGNLLTATDPAPFNHVTTWTYDAFNSVTSYTDALGNTTSLRYEHPTWRTLLTAVDEPPTQKGGPAITTQLAYYENEPPQPDSMLKSVRDPNGVLTLFEYDQWGQVTKNAEGEGPGGTPYLVYNYVNDSGSRVIKSHYPGGGGRAVGGYMNYNLVNQMTSSGCKPTREGSDTAIPPTFPGLPCAAPYFGGGPSGFVDTVAYNGLGNVIDQTSTMSCIANCGPSGDSRNYQAEFDELGFRISESIDRDEWHISGDRTFLHDTDLAQGRITRNGPDGVETLVQLDDAGRVEYMRRGPAGDPVMDAWYDYFADGRVKAITYRNGASVSYMYDEARRLTQIHHVDGIGQTMLRLTYAYTARDELATIDEFTGTSLYATEFTYDARGRLTRECRGFGISCDFGTPVYDLTYVYDDGGNRTQKIEAVNDRRIDYTYDYTDEGTYGSDNNRLMKYETFDTSGGGDVLLSTTYYYYSVLGNPTRIVTETAAPEPGEPQYSAVRFVYASNGQAVAVVVGESWNWDEVNCPTGYKVTFAREFRYDGGRQRYLVRTLDPDAMMEQPWRYEVLSDTWSDYDGDDIYGDFTIAGGSTTPVRSFEPGMAKVDPWTASGGLNTQYYHGNQIGTTRLMSDPSASPVGAAAYTAFGERITGPNHRYGYAGAWGYQSALDRRSLRPPLIPTRPSPTSTPAPGITIHRQGVSSKEIPSELTAD